MSRPTILAFQLADARLAKLRFLCMRLGVLVKPVPQEDFSQPMGALCGVSERVEAPAPAEPFAGEMIVFCHMDNALVNRFLQTVRQQRVPAFAIKAILTPTNAQWNASRLFGELRQEREAIASGGAAHSAEPAE